MHVGDLKFDPEDPTFILNFLAVYSSQNNALGLSEHEAYRALPYFLSKNALDHFRTAGQTSSSDSRAVTNWLSAVQFLLRKYASNANIQEALENLRAITQQKNRNRR